LTRWGNNGEGNWTAQFDGYWTPWHEARARIEQLERELGDHAVALHESAMRIQAAEARLARIQQAADAMRDEYRLIAETNCPCEVCIAMRAYDAIRAETPRYSIETPNRRTFSPA